MFVCNIDGLKKPLITSLHAQVKDLKITTHIPSTLLELAYKIPKISDNYININQSMIVIDQQLNNMSMLSSLSFTNITLNQYKVHRFLIRNHTAISSSYQIHLNHFGCNNHQLEQEWFHLYHIEQDEINKSLKQDQLKRIK